MGQCFSTGCYKQRSNDGIQFKHDVEGGDALHPSTSEKNSKLQDTPKADMAIQVPDGSIEEGCVRSVDAACAQVGDPSVASQANTSVSKDDLSGKGRSLEKQGKGEDTIRKEVVKRIPSSITISRSVSEEEKKVVDLPQTEVETYVYPTKSHDYLSQRSPKKLLDIKPLHLAQELSLLDKELLIEIPWNELSTCGWMSKDKHLRSPNVMSMVEFFNRIALLVASQILFEADPMMRVRVISKVIQVANKLRIMGNFNSLKALLAGLQCTPIYRLKETWKNVSSKRIKNFRKLSKLMSEEDNFAAYRRELNSLMSRGSPCLPFLGDFLTQVAQTQTYLACRKEKNSPESPKGSSSVNDSETIPSTTRRTQANGEHSPFEENQHHVSVARRRPCTIGSSKSSPNLPTSCSRTPEKPSNYRMNRFCRSRSWQHSNDSGIQMNDSDTNLSASPNSSLTSNTSLLSDSFASHSKSRGNDEQHFNSNSTEQRGLGQPNSTSTPLSVKSNVKRKLCRNGSVPGKCGSVSTSRTSLRTKMSFLRSFRRRSKGMDEAPSSGSIQSLRSTKTESGSSPGKFQETTEICKKTETEHDTTDGSGFQLQLWNFHMAAIQYNFRSRAHIRHFLLSTTFNTEEKNYKLSVRREPAAKKRELPVRERNCF